MAGRGTRETWTKGSCLCGGTLVIQGENAHLTQKHWFRLFKHWFLEELYYLSLSFHSLSCFQSTDEGLQAIKCSKPLVCQNYAPGLFMLDKGNSKHRLLMVDIFVCLLTLLSGFHSFRPCLSCFSTRF